LAEREGLAVRMLVRGDGEYLSPMLKAMID
jgi:hypothetical protein